MRWIGFAWLAVAGLMLFPKYFGGHAADPIEFWGALIISQMFFVGDRLERKD